MKLIRKSAKQPTLPAVRAIPPRVPSLRERRAVRITSIIIVAAAGVGALIGGAFQVVHAIERGVLPQSTFSLASLVVLAATAAYLAGRSERDRSGDTAADRGRARGRLVPAAKAQKDAAAAQAAAAADATTDASAGHEQAVALRTKFLDDISQELRAPITSICLAARIIRKHFDSTPEVVAHFGDTLLTEADRLGQTVDEFVELARLESGITEWRDTEVDAADLIQRAVANIESIAVSYGISVGFTLEPELPTLHADLDRVTQALTILLASGVRSASEGSEMVIQIAGAHGGWVFTVGGPSFVFPHAEARKVPVRGEDAENDVRPVEPAGRGLGLCLCREIVGHYHGRLWVEGTPGTQGCVRFTLPYRQHRRAAASAPTASAPQQKVAATAPRVESKPLASEGGAADLEQRRELAVKALRERAAGQPSAEAKPNAAAPEGVKPTLAESAPSAPRVEPQAATPATQKARAADTPETAAPTETLAAQTATTSKPERASKKAASSATTKPQAETPASAAPTSSVAATEPTPAAEPPQATEPPLSVRTETKLDDEAPLAASNDEASDDESVEIPEIDVEPSPVHAPVSGTMITAHHRTVGPPVLAHPGVPAVRGSSAASAAIQGSDELLLEIAQAQTADGRQLVVSEQVRSLLESAPGTLPAVAGQNLPQAAGARGAYTPTRRRMVAAPWVVRTSTDEAVADEPPPPPADPEVAAAQRARLNERLAKRLGIQRSGSSDSSSGRTSPSRSRRLG